MKNYDNYLIFSRPNRRKVSIGEAKQHRLMMKNSRRAQNGMSPKQSYSQI